MKTVTYDHFVQNPDENWTGNEAVLVTRHEGRPFVVLSQEEYESLDATAYLTRNPEATRELLESIRQLEAGHGIKKTLQELGI